MTIFWTIIAGVATYVVGQFVLKLVIDPAQAMKQTIGEIAHTLVHRAQVIMNPGLLGEEAAKETSGELRHLSSKLHGHLYQIPRYDFVRKVFFLPSKADVLAAATSLIGLSNGIFKSVDGIHKENSRRIESARDSLGIEMPEDERWPE